MDLQIAFNIAVALVGALGGYVLSSIRSSMRDLHAADNALADKVQRIEVLVAGQYVTHSDLEKMTNALFAKLDKIDIKLDTKQDKQ